MLKNNSYSIYNNVLFAGNDNWTVTGREKRTGRWFVISTKDDLVAYTKSNWYEADWDVENVHTYVSSVLEGRERNRLLSSFLTATHKSLPEDVYERNGDIWKSIHRLRKAC